MRQGIVQQALHVTRRAGPVMSIGTRDHLPELNPRIRPGLSLIAITKVIRSLRTVKHQELSEFIFTFQYVPQRRTQWRNSGSHRNKHQIAPFYFIYLKPTRSEERRVGTECRS